MCVLVPGRRCRVWGGTAREIQTWRSCARAASPSWAYSSSRSGSCPGCPRRRSSALCCQRSQLTHSLPAFSPVPASPGQIVAALAVLSVASDGMVDSGCCRGLRRALLLSGPDHPISALRCWLGLARCATSYDMQLSDAAAHARMRSARTMC